MTGAEEPGSRWLDARERTAWLRLLRSENIGPVTFRALIDRYGDAEAALEALPELAARGGLRRSIRICAREEAEAELAAAERLGLTLLATGEPGFPHRLDHADGAPAMIYVAGRIAALDEPAVAIVGARNCSASGRRLAQEIAAGLGASGLIVVSGLARGIDAAAHQASLTSGTVAVLAGGHARLYPPEHDALAGEILAAGAVISEMPPQWVARGKDFPRRNRIISGLAVGVVVIEAAARSGSLITARLAVEQGREVFAVPGSPLDPRAEGTNRLIRQGATLVRSAADVLEALSPGPLSSPPIIMRDAPQPVPDAGADTQDAHRRIQEALGPSPIGIDEIVRHTGLPVGSVMQVLLELELAGRLERHPGQRISVT
jgi:DNA processing protein